MSEDTPNLPNATRDRVQELLGTANRYLQRARDAEELLKEAMETMTPESLRGLRTRRKIRDHLKEPWKKI